MLSITSLIYVKQLACSGRDQSATLDRGYERAVSVVHGSRADSAAYE